MRKLVGQREAAYPPYYSRGHRPEAPIITVVGTIAAVSFYRDGESKCTGNRYAFRGRRKRGPFPTTKATHTVRTRGAQRLSNSSPLVCSWKQVRVADGGG